MREMEVGLDGAYAYDRRRRKLPRENYDRETNAWNDCCRPYLALFFLLFLWCKQTVSTTLSPRDFICEWVVRHEFERTHNGAIVCALAVSALSHFVLAFCIDIECCVEWTRCQIFREIMHKYQPRRRDTIYPNPCHGKMAQFHCINREHIASEMETVFRVCEQTLFGHCLSLSARSRQWIVLNFTVSWFDRSTQWKRNMRFGAPKPTPRRWRWTTDIHIWSLNSEYRYTVWRVSRCVHIATAIAHR